MTLIYNKIQKSYIYDIIISLLLRREFYQMCSNSHSLMKKPLTTVKDIKEKPVLVEFNLLAPKDTLKKTNISISEKTSKSNKMT